MSYIYLGWLVFCLTSAKLSSSSVIYYTSAVGRCLLHIIKWEDLLKSLRLEGGVGNWSLFLAGLTTASTILTLLCPGSWSPLQNLYPAVAISSANYIACLLPIQHANSVRAMTVITYLNSEHRSLLSLYATLSLFMKLNFMSIGNFVSAP